MAAEKPNFGEQVKEAGKDKVLTKDELTSMLTDEQIAALKQKGSEARKAFLELSADERREFQKELGMHGDEVDGLFGPNTLDHMFIAAGMSDRVALQKNKENSKELTNVSGTSSEEPKEQNDEEGERVLVNIGDYPGLEPLKVFEIEEAVIRDSEIFGVGFIESDSGERLRFVRIASVFSPNIAVTSASGRTAIYKPGQTFQFNGHRYSIAKNNHLEHPSTFTKVD